MAGGVVAVRLRRAREWTVDLTDADRDEIVVATARAIAAGTTIHDLHREDFVVPSLAATGWPISLGSRTRT
jgi:hypothetical protein